MVEGYDLVVFASIIPTLLETAHLGFTPESITPVATLALVGVGVGAACVGPLTDRVGRRRTIIGCVAIFSVLTLALPFSTSIAMFAVLRLLAGVGLGAVLPCALTYVAELRGSASWTTWTMTGYHVGAVISALLAVRLVDDWQHLFLIGGAAGLALLPILWRWLPESSAYLAGRDAAARGSVRALFRDGFGRATVGVWVTSFMGLLLVYGLNTWLPQIMRAAGYPLAGSLVMLLMMNAGAVVGLLVAGWFAPRFGLRRGVLGWFGASAVLLALLALRMESPLALNAVLFLAGAFVFSAQVLVYAWVTQTYPIASRGTALGMASGVGRLGAIVGPSLTGALVAADLAHPWGFYAFAAAAALALLAMATLTSPARDGAALVDAT
ncbi:MAG: aromatic acid/H+ symport family MFS transporter [Propionibacterium sp.]|nr:aromatic acid/H+ symport family MFS transporter [Propionibacterium sp.]